MILSPCFEMGAKRVLAADAMGDADALLASGSDWEGAFCASSGAILMRPFASSPSAPCDRCVAIAI
jgi:hypothetical protein